MFKSLITDPAFDTVKLISEALKSCFGGNGSDYAAGWIMLGCLLIIHGCLAAVAGRRAVLKLGCLALASLIIVFGVAPAIKLAGHQMVRLDMRKAKPYGGHAWRVKLNKDVLKRLEGKSWRLVETQRRYLAFPSLQESAFPEPMNRILPVTRDGGGRYSLTGGQLTYSSEHGVEGIGESTHWIVIKRTWIDEVHEKAISALALGLIALLLMVWLAWKVIKPLMHALWHPGFMLIAATFVAYYGSHQLRFLDHDHRMQMTTSRDDDGYMMERLMRTAEPPSMDPQQHGNSAYGAVAYYQFAALPATAALLKQPLPLEFLNAYVRGVKLLCSLLMLAAIWVLGARHFGTFEAVVATVYTASYFGFLKYSSYPFYPDVQMAAFALLAVHFSLELLDEWKDERFLLATLCAAVSVSIKFISFLVFPLLLFCALRSVWKQRGQPSRALRDHVVMVSCFVAVSIAVFFLCNPYLDYNLSWIVPNMKSVQDLYSTNTPTQVATQAATFSLWLNNVLMTGGDYSIAIAMVMCLVPATCCLLGWLLRRLDIRAGIWRKPDIHLTKSLTVLALALIWFFYLFKSINLPNAIDERLVLCIYPLFFILAAQAVRMVGQVLGLGQKTDLGAKTTGAGKVAATCVVGVLTLLLLLVVGAGAERVSILAGFHRYFGNKPERTALSNWLNDAVVPTDQTIVGSLQTYVPAAYKRVADWCWEPSLVEEFAFAAGDMPSLFVEDEFYYSAFFTKRAGQGIAVPGQAIVNETGREFYQLLDVGGMPPFVPVAFDQEISSTTSFTPPQTGPVRIYANRFAFAEKLIPKPAFWVNDLDGERQISKPFGPDTAELKRSTSAVEYRWSHPVMVEAIHIGTVETGSPLMMCSWIFPAGNQQERAFTLPQLNHLNKLPTEQFIYFDEPQEVVSLKFCQADRRSLDLTSIRELRVLPPVPLGINPTRTFFSIHGDGGGDWQRLIQWRAAPVEAGVEIKANGSREFSLKGLERPAAMKELLVVLAGSRVQASAECRMVFADGSEEKLFGRLRHSVSPAVSWFSFAIRSGHVVRESRCKVSNTALDGESLRLIQVGTHLRPMPRGD